jgi:hypothetical protein
MRKIILVAGVMFGVMFLASCAAGPNQMTGLSGHYGSPAGFWRGLWHGFIVLFTFIASLFTDKVSIYEVHNTGKLYHLGYLLGIMIFFGGSGKSSGCSWKRD